MDDRPRYLHLRPRKELKSLLYTKEIYWFGVTTDVDLIEEFLTQGKRTTYTRLDIYADKTDFRQFLLNNGFDLVGRNTLARDKSAVYTIYRGEILALINEEYHVFKKRRAVA